VGNIEAADSGSARTTRVPRAARDTFSCVHYDNYSASVPRHL